MNESLASQAIHTTTNNGPMTVPQVAQRLQVTPKTVYGAIARGELGSIRVGRHLRITEAQYAAYLSRS